jgi:DNA modification methylase
MSLRQRIQELLNAKGRAMTMRDIYTQFPDIKKTTIRGRVYDGLGKGVRRIDRGLYISSEAVVELGNTLEVVDRLIEQGDTFDFIFLDIPYSAGGQKGGNRKLFELDTIDPSEFGGLLQKLEQLLRTDNSPLIFMFTSGKTSRPMYKKYKAQFANSILKQCNPSGTYYKMWPNGNRMNMGKYPMPAEWIHVYSRSGNVPGIEEWKLAFTGVPDKSYPTAKPYEMIRCLVEQATHVGEWVLDPFGGSGKTLAACLELKRMCHIIDNNPEALRNHMLPILVNHK